MHWKPVLPSLVRAVAAVVCLFPALAGASAPPRLAVLPLEIYGDKELGALRAGLSDLLAARIGAEGSVELVRSSAVHAALTRLPGAAVDEDRVEALGKELGADSVLWGSLTRLGRSTSVTLKLTRIAPRPGIRYFTTSSDQPDELLAKLGALGTEVGKAVAEGAPASSPAAASSPAPPAPPLPPAAAVSAPPVAPALQPAAAGSFPFRGARLNASDELPFLPRGLAGGDVDGDGRKELVFIDESTVYVYRYGKTGAQLLAKASGKGFENYVAVSVGDGTPSGAGRVFVTSMRDKPHSFALEYRDGALRPIGVDLPWFVRTVESLGGGSALLAQELSLTGWPFQAPPRRIVAKGKGYEAAGPADLPKGFAIYHFAAADLDGEKRPEFVAIDGAGRLLVYGADKTLVARWGEGFGNSCVTWDASPEGWNERGPSQVIQLPVDPVVRDLDGDGRQELLLARNLPDGGLSLPGRLPYYPRSEVKGLRWDGATLDTVGTVEGIDGCITGLVLGDLDGDGAEDLAVAVLSKKIPGLPLSAGKGTVRVYSRR